MCRQQGGSRRSAILSTSPIPTYLCTVASPSIIIYTYITFICIDRTIDPPTFVPLRDVDAEELVRREGDHPSRRRPKPTMEQVAVG